MPHWGTLFFPLGASSVASFWEGEHIGAGDVPGCSQLPVGTSETSVIVWHSAVQMDGRAEAFDIMVFAFFCFPKSDHLSLILCCDL